MKINLHKYLFRGAILLSIGYFVVVLFSVIFSEKPDYSQPEYWKGGPLSEMPTNGQLLVYGFSFSLLNLVILFLLYFFSKIFFFTYENDKENRKQISKIYAGSILLLCNFLFFFLVIMSLSFKIIILLLLTFIGPCILPLLINIIGIPIYKKMNNTQLDFFRTVVGTILFYISSIVTLFLIIVLAIFLMFTVGLLL